MYSVQPPNGAFDPETREFDFVMTYEETMRNTCFPEESEETRPRVCFTPSELADE
jgi:hypothetical protein